MRLPAILLASLVLFFSAGCAGISFKSRLTGFDAPVKPQEQVVLKAKVKGPGIFIRPNLPYRKVEFYDGDRLLGTAVTNWEGVASLLCAFDEEGFHRISLSYPGDRARGKPGSFLWIEVAPKDKPFLIVDIDNTICAGNFLDEVFLRVDRLSPLPGAAETLTRLSSRYGIIYLTARDDGLINDTRAWLDKNGFPHGLILCRDFGLTTLSSSRFKSGVLKDLNRRFSNVVAGIGDREGDGKAFRRNGLLAILFHKNDKDMKDVWFIKDWKEVAALLETLGTRPPATGASHSTE